MREIETKRLLLRKLRSDDAESIFRNWASDSEVAKYVTWNVHKDINETKAILDMWLAEYYNDNCYRYGIENKADRELIGMIDVVGYHHGNPVIGYCSCRRYWGNGYMTEALGAVMKNLRRTDTEHLLSRRQRTMLQATGLSRKTDFSLSARERIGCPRRSRRLLR